MPALIPVRPMMRHELKLMINYGEYLHLSRTLDLCMHRDPAGDDKNEYAVRSLYFDTVFDDFLVEKVAGVGDRVKYRIRIYNFSDETIKLERKSKVGDLIAKQSLTIPRGLADQIIGGDATGLETTGEPLLRDVFREMKTRLLRPVVIVDYVREAYTHPAEEVRITFDKKLRSGIYNLDLFNRYVPTAPVLDHELIVLEVKFNRVLPDHIRALLSGAVAKRMAVSKYVLCRRFEELEF